MLCVNQGHGDGDAAHAGRIARRCPPGGITAPRISIVRIANHPVRQVVAAFNCAEAHTGSRITKVRSAVFCLRRSPKTNPRHAGGVLSESRGRLVQLAAARETEPSKAEAE